VFSQADSAAISDKYTAVRLLGGYDLDDEGRAFAGRYGVSSFPTLLAMTPTGAVLTRSFQRDTAGILETMSKAADLQAAFEKKKAELEKKTDAASIRSLARLQQKRLELEAARTGFEALVAKEPLLDDQVALLGVLKSLGDQAASQKLLAALVKDHRADARWIGWRIALALADVPTEFASLEARQAAEAQTLASLKQLLEEVEAKNDQAAIRLKMASLLNRSRNREEALAHWDWILKNARDSASAPEALMQTATALFRGADSKVERLEEVKNLLKEIVDKHPDHPAAADAGRYIVAVQKSIDKLKAQKPAGPPGGS
jgi:tetratricopeptide (TPR) repeat protein